MYEDAPAPPQLRNEWRGKFADNILNFNDPAYVIIPNLDPNLKIGPCRWQARDSATLPTRGKDCLVIFDNNNEPWVVAWWPFGWSF